MEKIFWFFGFSFLISQLLVYVVLLVVGYIISKRLVRFIRFVGVKIGLKIVGTLIPAILYFAIFPIYEGDIYEMSRESNSTIKFPENKSLTVVALPNCPYCVQSIELLNKLVKYKSNEVSVQYWILGSAIDDSLKYRRLLDKNIQIKRISMDTSILYLTEGAYPTFVLSEQGKAICAWDNNGFGIRAWDRALK